MSELSMYELEDIAWDEFCQSDDHIVPHPGSERADDNRISGDRHKKPQCEITSIPSNPVDRSATGYVDQGREREAFSSLSKRNSLSEKDLMKEASRSASENNFMSSRHGFKSNNKDSNGCENGANDTILGDKTLADATQTGNNTDFFENTEVKESNDFLYYGWPEIGNFEDVDRMFRSCDSTFGLGGSNENELGWLSSADSMGGSGDVVKSDFMFTCPESNAVENILQSHDSSRSCSTNDLAMTSAPTRYKDSSWISENSDSYLSFVNVPAMADSKDGLITKQQGVGLNGKIQPKNSTNNRSKTGSSGMINEQKKQFKLQNQTTGKRKEHYSGNGSFSYTSNLTNETMQFPPSVHMQQQQQAFGPGSYSYLQNPLSYVHSDRSNLSNQKSVKPRPSAIKSEANELRSFQLRVPSHASSQLESAENSRSPLGSKRREKLHNHQGLDSTLKAASGSVDKIENHSLVVPVELGSSNVQESTTMGSGLNDTSMEAASFRQLQLAMEQLDVRTKLCIRDSLYRLARSAEQRHNNNHANLNGDERDASGAFMAAGTNNFMDIETDTNPIDRSIAHLLFHRPSESSAKTHNAVHGSIITSPPVIEENMVDNLVVCDETGSELEEASERKLLQQS